MEVLTEKQRQVLEAVRNGIETRGFSPTVREIGAMLGLSSSCTVKKHLDALETKGYIRRDRYQRGVELLDGGGDPISMGRAVCVPLLGRVAGGAPILAHQSDEPEMLPLPQSLLPRGTETGKDLFALEVYGDSMRDAGISDGDIVIAKRQNSARDGEIIVALIGEEATVKTFYAEADYIRLQPENPAFEPIFTKDMTVLGKVTLSIKRFN